MNGDEQVPADADVFAVPSPLTPAAPPRRWRRRLLFGLGALAALGLLFAVSVAVFFDIYWIPSEAMAPTLQRGDRVLVRGVDGDDVGRGDVVIHAAPEESGIDVVVKRVVAVAGDRVGERNGRLTVNGVLVDEPYLAEGTRTEQLEPMTVPDEHVYVLGDNRPSTLDSRQYGPVPYDDIEGLVVMRIWSPSRVGGVD